MIVRDLFSLLTRRRRLAAGRPQVLVTLERPWDKECVRRFGPLEEVMGRRTVGELVQSLAEAASRPDGPEEAEGILPERFDVQVQGIGDPGFRTVKCESAALPLLGESPTGADSPRVHHLRIRIMPLSPEGNEDRSTPTRHSDKPKEEAPAVELSEAVPAPREEAPVEPVVRPQPAERQPAAPPAAGTKLRGYMRKADVLRADLLPKIQALDFSGLFVGNFGVQARSVEKAPRVSLLDPQTANKYLVLANQHRKEGQYEKAIHLYNTLVTHDPDNEDFWFLLGKTAAQMGRVRQAVHAFATARRLGHSAARDELSRLRAGHPEVVEQGGDLLRLWRPSFSPERSADSVDPAGRR